MNFNKIVALTVLSLFSVNLYAGLQALTVNTTNNEHRVYAGLVWTLKEKLSLVPDATIGFRSVRVKSNDNVSGGDISARIIFNNGIAFDSTRLSYVGGDRDVLGNFGIGYSATHSSFLGTAAIQGPYARIGVDYEIQTKAFESYLEINTLSKEDKPGCPINYIAFNSSCILNAPSDRRLKRQIKLLATLDNGIKIYSFKYLWSDITFVGVMAQDLLENPEWKNAVVTMNNGFYAVNYSMLGLQMTTQEQWKLYGLDSIMVETINL